MATPRTITAANSIYLLSITNLYPAPQLLQGYAADAAFDTDATEVAETVMGVDGHMSAGYIPFITPQTISVMPDSLTSDLFENWIQASALQRDVYWANAKITLPSTGRTYTLTNGVISSGPIIPGAGKVLKARTFRISWESIISGVT